MMGRSQIRLPRGSPALPSLPIVLHDINPAIAGDRAQLSSCLASQPAVAPHNLRFFQPSHRVLARTLITIIVPQRSVCSK
jgi:hypothetical protein